jgi:MFS family permease
VRSKTGTVVALGTAQTLSWASSYYLPAVLVGPMARDLGVSQPTIFAAFSAALLVSALLGPQAGRAIDRYGGRPVLVGSNLLFAIGLAGLASAHGPVTLFAAWAVLGLAMGCGLYEAAFAALVRLYGRDSRSAITGITLLAGFASTVGWPLTTWLSGEVGWRGACLAWAALHLVLGMPLNAWLPRAPASAAPAEKPAADAAPAAVGDGSAMRTTVLLSYAFAATWFVSTAMAAHLPGSCRPAAPASRQRSRSVPSSGRRRWREDCSNSAFSVTSTLAFGSAGRLAAPRRGGHLARSRSAGKRRLRGAARGRQRHPDHRQGNAPARLLRALRLRLSPGPADGADAPGASPGSMAVRALPRSLGGRRDAGVGRPRPDRAMRPAAAAEAAGH